MARTQVKVAPTRHDCCPQIHVGDQVVHWLPGMVVAPAKHKWFTVHSIEHLSDNDTFYIYGEPGVGGAANAHHLQKNHP